MRPLHAPTHPPPFPKTKESSCARILGDRQVSDLHTYLVVTIKHLACVACLPLT